MGNGPEQTVKLKGIVWRKEKKMKKESSAKKMIPNSKILRIPKTCLSEQKSERRTGTALSIVKELGGSN